jgi:dipicolinate synthase subunit A
MFSGTVLCVPRTEAIRYGARFLSEQNIRVTEKCAPDVTHVLLPVPSFSRGDEYLAHLLTGLPDDVIICGGNLNSALTEGYPCVDFLQDVYYLADNAALTAECALKILKQQFQFKPDKKKVLIIGWGRIGKCLCPMMKQWGADVTVAARKVSDLAMIHALGYNSIPISDTASETKQFDVILNTVPVLLFPQIELKENCIAMELASKPGMTGPKIYDARGLPGKIAPMKSGKLIADTFLRLAI